MQNYIKKVQRASKHRVQTNKTVLRFVFATKATLRTDAGNFKTRHTMLHLSVQREMKVISLKSRVTNTSASGDEKPYYWAGFQKPAKDDATLY
jgi:hypothetical protein